MEDVVGKLQDRIALVTGGHRGIGRAIAEAFAREGADVAIADVCAESGAESILTAIERLGRRALFLPTDVSREDEVQRAVDRVLDAWERIDILVNNAGILAQTPLHEMTVEEWDRVIAVNLRGTFLCSRAVLPQMLERRSGRIINIASQLGQLGEPNLTHYSASKGGIIAFTKALAREVAAQGVLVNAIAPGPIETGIMPSTPEAELLKLAQLPIHRFGQVDEVAPTAVFLASDDASYYVGQTLGPNGGDVML
jgi:3-oxoacyl-[acyl-carrier protein] reductase